MPYNRNLYSSSESAIDAGMIYDQTEEKLQSEINAEVSSDITELDDSLSTFVRPNLLDNWYFVGGGSQLGDGVFPINQKGQTSYSGNVTTIDRWRASTAGTSITLFAAYVRFTASAQGANFFQEIKEYKQLAGKVVTLSAMVGDHVIGRTVEMPTTLPALTDQTVTLGTTLPITNYENSQFNGYSLYMRHIVNVGVVFYITAGSTYTDSLDMKDVKLEIGTTQTLAHQENGEWVLNEIPNFTEELTKCQREDGNFIETTPFDLSTLPASNTYGKYIGAKDKDNYVWFYMQPVHNTAGRLSMMYAVRRLINGSPVTNGFYLGINSDGSLAVTVDSPAAWRTALGALYRAGDTMTGNLTISKDSPMVGLKNTSLDVTSSSYSSITMSAGLLFYDKNQQPVANYTDRYEADGSTGILIGGNKRINNANYWNYLRLLVKPDGTKVVMVTDPAAWRKALGLCYAINDIYTTSAGVNLPAISNGNSKIIYITAHVDKSMENISTVTVTSLNGWIAGPNGALNNSATSVQFVGASDYTVACTKLSNQMVRIQLTKSSAFTNSVNNSSVVYFGTLTLKFT